AQVGKLGVIGTGILIAIWVCRTQSGVVGSNRRLVDITNPGEIRAVVSHIGDLPRKIWSEGVLQVERPVPNVGSGNVPGDAHDGTRIVEAIESCGADIGAIEGNT